jgi:predicted permease
MPEWAPHIRRQLAELRLDPKREAEIVEELSQHLEDRYAELCAEGVAEEQAERAVLDELQDSGLLARELDRVEQPPEEPAVPGAGGPGWRAGLGHDLRYGLRMLRRNPGFTAVVVLTLALGIGANTAIFSVVNGVLLRPLPYLQPNRLMMVWHNNTKENEPRDFVSYPAYLDLRSQSRTFSRMGAVSPRWRFVLPGAEGPQKVQGFWVSASLFDVLGVRPFLGRTFTAAEDKPGGAPAVILSYALWQSRFSGDPEILGKTIPLDNLEIPVVGVMPRGFHFLEDVALWAPLGQNPFLRRGRAIRMLQVVGRLAPGATPARAQAEMTTLTARLAREYPDTNAGLGATVVSLDEQIVGKVRPALLVLFAAVVLVLLIACANVANLLVQRAAVREKEIAVRKALGAGRFRLVRQFLTESVLLGLLGGAGGLGLAFWGLRVLRRLGPAGLPRLRDVSIDPAVLAFTLGISLLTGIVFGLWPARRLAHVDLQETLKEGGRTTESRGRRRGRNGLVVLEVALALVMATGAGLLIRSFARLMAVDPGFVPGHLLTLQLGLPSSYAKPAQRVAFYRRMFSRIESLPGVEAAGGVTRLPLGPHVTTTLGIQGHPVPLGREPEVDFRRVSTNYFRAMGISLRSGRAFNARDDAGAPPVAIINQTAARRFWPGKDPLGSRVRFGNDSSPWYTVIGVVGNVRQLGLDQPAEPAIYIAFDQGPPTGPLLAIRTSMDPTALIPAVRRELRALEPRLLISDVKTMEQIVHQSTGGRRFNTLLLSVFAALALALAAVGIYGLMSYTLAERRHEIGIRMALGAQPAQVLRMMLGEGMKLALLGVAIGVAGSLALMRLLSSLLFGVTPTDPWTFAGVVVVLTVVALAACYVPVRRAIRVDPVAALRYE